MLKIFFEKMLQKNLTFSFSKSFYKKHLTLYRMAVIIIAVCRTVRYKFHNRTPKLASNY